MRGGIRPGAGRKKGFAARNAEEARRILSAMVVREIEPIGEALIARAKEGEIAAARELFDRAWGKAPQSSNLTIQEVSHVGVELLMKPELLRFESELKRLIAERG